MAPSLGKLICNNKDALNQRDEDTATMLEMILQKRNDSILDSEHHNHTKTTHQEEILEIAEARSFSVDTIIGHIEKLLELKEEVKLAHTLPPKKIVITVKKAFKELDTRKLTPVYEHLKGKYSYQDIRIVRATFEIHPWGN